MTLDAHRALDRLLEGGDLSRTEMETLFDRLMGGEISEPVKAGLLIALRMKGETPAEIAGAAAAMRRRAVPIPHHREQVVDTCGTGGDRKGTFNISTAAALVTAAAGVPVAKQGNRSVSSRSGSADVLAALGVDIRVSAGHGRAGDRRDRHRLPVRAHSPPGDARGHAGAQGPGGADRCSTSSVR